MKALMSGRSAAVALLLAGVPGFAPALAQERPAAAPPPAQHASPSSAPAAPALRHAAHRRHRARHARLTPDQAGSIAPQPQPAAAAHPGTEPAPVPNEDIGPPDHAIPARGEVTPGSMSIHYPPVGEGYLPGSSSTDMDNRTTPAVPGVQYQEPLTNPAPQPLPPPDTANLPRP